MIKLDKNRQDRQLLSDVLTTAEGGLMAVELLMEKTKDERIQASLTSQRERYRQLKREAEQKLRDLGAPAERLSAISAAGIRLSAAFTGGDPEQVESLMKQSSEISAADLRRSIQGAPDAGGDARALAEGLLDAEQKTAKSGGMG